MNILKEISKELGKRKVFHKVEKRLIRTRRSKVKIPLMSKDIAYLIGVIAGDGSLVKCKRKRGGEHYILTIYAEKEKYLILLNGLFKKHFKILGKISKDKRKNSLYYLRFQNASIFFYFFLKGNEIGKKKRFHIPKEIKEEKRYFLEYLSGLIDTDGHISGNRIQLKQKSEKLLKEISRLTNKENLNCSIPKVNYTNQKPYYYIRFDNKITLRFKTNNFLKSKK